MTLHQLADITRQDISPASFSDSPLHLVLQQPFLLGLFLPIQNGGWSISTRERTTDWQLDYNKRLTLQAEALWLDLVFGLAEWNHKGGYGGETRYREHSIDPFMTTAALGAVTSRILLISTLHILYGPWHPLHLARFGASLDLITGGRWGLNMVTGNQDSYARMFGAPQIEHDKRYRMAQEFTDLLKGYWFSEEHLNHQGEFWSTQDGWVTAKPRYGRPILVNATGSQAGMDYAACHSDLVFITSPAGAEIDAALAALPAHTAQVKAAAAAQQRQVRTLINPMVICRPPEKEAWDYYREIVARQSGWSG